MHTGLPRDVQFGLPEELQRDPDPPQRNLLLPVFIAATAVVAVVVWVPLP